MKYSACRSQQLRSSLAMEDTERTRSSDDVSKLKPFIFINFDGSIGTEDIRYGQSELCIVKPYHYNSKGSNSQFYSPHEGLQAIIVK